MVRSFALDVDGYLARRNEGAAVSTAFADGSQATTSSTPRSIERLQTMTVFVVEIKGRSIVAFHAETSANAEGRLRDRIFRNDLMVLTSKNVALWDGICGLDLRPAHPSEEAIWRASHAGAIRRGNIEDDDYEWVAFLVALSDPQRQRERR
jgi:hypothetical protein